VGGQVDRQELDDLGAILDRRQPPRAGSSRDRKSRETELVPFLFSEYPEATTEAESNLQSNWGQTLAANKNNMASSISFPRPLLCSRR
jgi:hypothetical protein